jgi:hypothetical protein
LISRKMDEAEISPSLDSSPQTFLDFDLFKKDIDHIDGMMSHNCMTNLEFTMRAENKRRREYMPAWVAQPKFMPPPPIGNLDRWGWGRGVRGVRAAYRVEVAVAGYSVGSPFGSTKSIALSIT